MKKFGIEGEGFDFKVAWLFEHSNSEMKAQGRRIFIMASLLRRQRERLIDGSSHATRELDGQFG